MSCPRPLRDASTTVHVVGRTHARACAALRAALPPRISIRHWETALDPKALYPADIIVIDLSDMRCGTTVGDTGLSAGTRSAVIIIHGDDAVDPSWLDVASRRQVIVVGQDPSSADGSYWRVISAVAERTLDLSADELARRLVESNPVLTPAAQLVQAVCEDPWAIRHPRDLARDAGIGAGFARGLASAAGFTRVEHLISVVRQGIVDETVRACGLPRATCLRLAGVTQSSNHRRQLARARLGSPAAFPNGDATRS